MATENTNIKNKLAGKILTVADVVKTGTGTFYYKCDINWRTHIIVDKQGSTATVKYTNTLNDDIELGVYSADKSSAGDADFDGGDSAGISGVEVDITAFVGNVSISIIQYPIKGE